MDLIVVKAGGELALRPDWAAGVAQRVAGLREEGTQVVFVHGGGPQLDSALVAEGVAVHRVAGRRATTPDVLQRAVQLWRGSLSVQWVQAFQRADVSAVGLSGVDGRILRAVRRPPTEVDGVVVDFGEVGDLVGVGTGALHALLGSGFVPIVSPLAVSEAGEVLNVNADTVAAHLAVALSARELVLLTRSPGVLSDPEDPTSTLVDTSLAELAALEVTGAIQGGMRPKIAAVRHAIAGGVQRARVVDGSAPAAAARGTVIAA